MVSRAYSLRGVVGVDLTEQVIKRFAKNVVKYVSLQSDAKNVLIAKDNRVSGDYILSIIKSVLLANGVAVYLIGETSTPELAFITRKFHFGLGIMITASHNSWEYNGLKCYNTLGEAISVTDEGVISCKKTNDYKKVVNVESYHEVYLRELKNQLKENKIKCIFDCANGVTTKVVRNIFAKHKIIGNDTSGRLVNNDNGTEDLSSLITQCKRSKKIGFAFDGDGDRVIAVDTDGTIINGDKILYILATQFLSGGDKVVGTIVSSLALEKALNNLGITLIREQVGAKYMYKRMVKEGALLGGEPCGHIFLAKNTVSNGVYIAIEILNILNRTGLNFKQLLQGYKDLYQVNKNIELSKLKDVDYLKYNRRTKDFHIVIRKSETEPLIRILIEGENKDIVNNEMDKIISELVN